MSAFPAGMFGGPVSLPGLNQGPEVTQSEANGWNDGRQYLTFNQGGSLLSSLSTAAMREPWAAAATIAAVLLAGVVLVGLLFGGKKRSRRK